jgi:hypothetical protein
MQEAQKIITLSREDPVWFIKEALGAEPWELQCAIANSVRDNTETSVASCHGPGKSWIAARIALWFLYCFKPSIVLTTAPTDRQVKGILWKEIAVAHANANYKLGGKLLTQELTIEKDWFAIGFTAPDYDSDRFQGWHEQHLLVIVDEACGVSKNIMDGIDGVLSSGHTRKLSIGNPTDPVSAFAGDFKRADVNKIYISAYDTPNFTPFGITEEDIINNTWEEKITGPLPNPNLVTPSWVARMTAKWHLNSSLYTAKIKGQFPLADKNSLFSLAQIDAAQNRKIEPDKPIELAADIARFGDDETVIGYREGARARILLTTAKEDTMQTTGRIVQAANKIDPSEIKVDSVGVGAGVVDRLNEQGYNVIEMNGGFASDDPEKYLNKRAEWYWELRERFEAGLIDIDPADEELASQLSNIKYKLNSKGKIQIESKEEMKKRELPSPDRADWLAYVFGKGKEELEIVFC